MLEINSLRIEPSSPSRQMDRVVNLMSRMIEERSGSRLGSAAADAATLRLVAGDTDGEGFSISSGNGSIVIEGDSPRGLLFGVGKFLHTSGYADGLFVPSEWRGRDEPESTVRTLYLATHFHNFYQDAPLDEVIEYIEEMSLWGYNTIAVWFDRHEFNGLDDPAAAAMLDRLATILEATAELGLQTSMTVLANEGYANSPEHLRADFTAGQNGYHTVPEGIYNVELCPSKPEALSLIVKEFEELTERIASFGLDFLMLWPYDQGGCTCSDCAPWGANGFLRAAEPLARTFSSKSPKTNIILSTWYFDLFTTGEWEGLSKAFSTTPDWAHYLLAGAYGGLPFPEHPVTHGVPGGLPMVCFPEISMYGMWPWGGFGANVRPDEIQEMWQSTKGMTSGGVVYSEGIFEDLNKVTIAQLFWRTRPVDEIVREYAAYEFGPESADSVRSLVRLLESTTIQTNQEHAAGLPDDPALAPLTLSVNGPDIGDQAMRLAQEIEGTLATSVKAGWRWRIIYLRSVLQAELSRTDPDERVLKTAFDELTAIYHAEHADTVLRPPM